MAMVPHRIATIYVRVQPGKDYADLHRMGKREWARHVAEAFAIELDDVIVVLTKPKPRPPGFIYCSKEEK